MNRYFIHFSFLGTNYHGWQIQPNAITVQEIMEEAISRLIREKITLYGCGRTDSGVHARSFYAHFNTGVSLSQAAASTLAYQLNGYLPEDIAVFEVKPVLPDVHARFTAISRTYQYFITTRKDPFLKNMAWFYHHGELDLQRLNKGAAILMEYADFECFSKKDTDITGTNCVLMESYWQQQDHLLIYTVTANRFLRNMVRAIVGTLLEMGRGKWDEEKIRTILESKDRCKAGESVPAHGLFLTNVSYPDGIFRQIN